MRSAGNGERIINFKSFCDISLLTKQSIKILLVMKTTLDIIFIARTGVDLVVDASSKTTMDLKLIIDAVVNTGAHITLKNCDKKTTMDLAYLCNVSPKNITIDFA